MRIIPLSLILTACIVNFMLTSAKLMHAQTSHRVDLNKMNSGGGVQAKFRNWLDSVAKNDIHRSNVFRDTLKDEIAKEQQDFDAAKEDFRISRNRIADSKKNLYGNINAGDSNHRDTRDTDEDQMSEELDIFNFNLQKPNFFTTPSVTEDVPTARTVDPEIEYRHGILDAIQLFNAQDIQINYTRVHFANVWGAEDEGVKRISAKLNSMEAFLYQKLVILDNRLNGTLGPRERSIMPMDWTTLDMLRKGWKEIERFIDGKIAVKSLTTAEENELYALREWLKFSDQELAIPYDTMKDRMEKVWRAESPEPYTLQPTPAEPTKIQPFSVH